MKHKKTALLVAMMGTVALTAGCSNKPKSSNVVHKPVPVASTTMPSYNSHEKADNAHTVIIQNVGTQSDRVQQSEPEIVDNKDNYRPVRVTAIGYGATSNYEGYTDGQQRLMAIRASKLDAYRSLAEQIYGAKINGNTTVSAMMSKSDGFRARIDAMIRGARVISVTPMADSNYETVVEVFFDPDFYKDVFVYSRESEDRYRNQNWMY